MSRKFDYGKVVSTVEKLLRTFPDPIRSVQVPIRRKEIRFGHPVAKTGEGHYLKISSVLTDLFRDERIELNAHVAHAVRPYAELLINTAIRYGDCHKPTMEVCDYYLKEKELIHKLFKILVPRYKDSSSSCTAIHRLPDVYKEDPVGVFKYVKTTILELKGNPYGSVVAHKEYKNSLINVLVSANSRRSQSDAQ